MSKLIEALNSFDFDEIDILDISFTDNTSSPQYEKKSTVVSYFFNYAQREYRVDLMYIRTKKDEIIKALLTIEYQRKTLTEGMITYKLPEEDQKAVNSFISNLENLALLQKNIQIEKQTL